MTGLPNVENTSVKLSR